MRKTIYLGNETERYLQYHSNHTGSPKTSHSLSKVVNIVIDRYSEIVGKNIPSLENNEWLLVVNALKDAWVVEPAKNTLTIITGKIEETLSAQETLNKYAVDPEALRGKLQGASMEQKFAMLDVTEIFWLSLKRTDPDLDAETGIKRALAISRREED